MNNNTVEFGVVSIDNQVVNTQGNNTQVNNTQVNNTQVNNTQVNNISPVDVINSNQMNIQIMNQNEQIDQNHAGQNLNAAILIPSNQLQSQMQNKQNNSQLLDYNQVQNQNQIPNHNQLQNTNQVQTNYLQNEQIHYQQEIALPQAKKIKMEQKPHEISSPPSVQSIHSLGCLDTESLSV